MFLFSELLTFVITRVCNFDITVACAVRDDKSINKVCLRTLVAERGAYVIDIQKWSVVYANASKAIHPPYMEISLVPDTYNAARYA